jgi:hypothetical protein
MQLNKQAELIVFQVDNTHFEAIGDVAQYTSVKWPEAYCGYATFELWAPVTEENIRLLKEGYFIWNGSKSAVIIESVKSSLEDDGSKRMVVQGRTLEKILLDRILWGGYSYTNIRPSTLMYNLVNECCVNPSNADRKLPYLICAEDQYYGDIIPTVQRTGGWLYNALYEIAGEELGFDVEFDPENENLVFRVTKGVDRTLGNTGGVDPVIFSSQLEDVLNSSYYSNSSEEKNVALVQGEDSGSTRKSEVSGDNTLTGYDRKEVYVDARDLQSEVYHEDGTSTTLTPQEYLQTLRQRGDEALASYSRAETFEASIRQVGNIQYVYGRDYTKGDMVTVEDEGLGVIVSARVVQIEEDFSDGYDFYLQFGYSIPTILQKIKRATNYNS